MYNNAPLIVQKMLGQRSGRAGMVTNLRVKNLVTGSTMDLGLDAGEKFDEVDLQTHTTKLSYIDGEGDSANYVFMDQETFDQFELSKSDLGDNAGYITPEDDVEVQIHPQRYLPEQCRFCRYKSFVESAVKEQAIEDECSVCKAMQFAKENGYIYDPTNFYVEKNKKNN